MLFKLQKFHFVFIFVLLVSCKTNQPIPTTDDLIFFQGTRTVSIQKTCTGDPVICAGFNSLYSDTFDLYVEGQKARVQYVRNGIDRLMTLDSSSTQNRSLYVRNYGPHDYCSITLDNQTDSFFVKSITGGLAATMQWEMKGKR